MICPLYPFSAIIFLSAFLLAAAIILWHGRYRRLEAHGTEAAIPRTGGMGIGVSFVWVSLLALAGSGQLSRAAAGILFSSMIMLLLGLVDDRFELSVPAKFLTQLVAAGILLGLGVKTQIIRIGSIPNFIITLLWVLGITNAFNLLDIMDGLAAGCALIIGASFFVLAVLSQDMFCLILSLALAGSVLGLFVFNLPPARVYMGNAGSHFLGFVLAAVAMAISYAPVQRKVALASPLLILGLPIFDTLFVMLTRALKKSSPFKKSDDHLALKLLALGWPKGKALRCLLGLCLFYCLCGIAVAQVPNAAGAMIIFLSVLVSLMITVKMNRAS